MGYDPSEMVNVWFTNCQKNIDFQIIETGVRAYLHLNRPSKDLPGKHNRLGVFAHKPKCRIPRQNPKNLSMSAKIGFTATPSKQMLYNIPIDQQNSLCCLPSRDRTAGLKIPDLIRFDPPKGIEVQLQSCALPAELRRVDELVCSRDDRSVLYINI
jgi:hypothetical protein